MYIHTYSHIIVALCTYIGIQIHFSHMYARYTHMLNAVMQTFVTFLMTLFPNTYLSCDLPSAYLLPIYLDLDDFRQLLHVP